MNVLTTIWGQLVRSKLWPLALLLVAALVAVPFVLAKEPEPPVPPTPATAAPAESADASKLKISYTWAVNSSNLTGQTNKTLTDGSTSTFKKGDLVTCSATSATPRNSAMNEIT